MASNIPEQSRAVDPFASYNSNTVNTLTRMITYGDDGLANAVSCDVSVNTTTSLILSIGHVYKSDVWINVSSPFIIDFNDQDHYYDYANPSLGFNEAGTYYIVLDYTFVKSRPAPQAKILIIKPSQIGSYSPGGSWLFLKAVTVTGSGPFSITSVADYDASNPLNKRTYVKAFTGTEVQLPTFNAARDVSRITYNAEDDNFYFGRSNKWEPLKVGAAGAAFTADTRGFAIGDLIYMNFSEKPSKADARNSYVFSDGVVDTVAEEGIVKTNGLCANVQVETGIFPVAGNLLYLSKTEKGKVTTEQTTPIKQFVGRCLSVTAPGVIELIYHRGQADEDSDFFYGCGVGEATLNSSSWVIGPGGYYQDVDISTVQQKNLVVTVWDSTSELEITPSTIEFIDNSTMRIWSTAGTEEANVFISGSSSTCVSSDSMLIYQILSSSSWINDGVAGISFPGSEPGTFYYQDIVIGDIDGKEANVLIRDADTKLQLTDKYIQFDTTNIIRIWTDDDTDSLEVTAIGPKNLSSSTTTPLIISFSSILPNYSWNFWTDANLVTELIPSSKWGPSVSSANWAPDANSTLWGGGSDSTAVSIFEDLYYQDIDISFYLDNPMVLEFYNRANNKILQPTYVEFLSQDIIRVWMTSSNFSLNFTILGRFSS